MHLRAKRPVLVPDIYQQWLEEMSKAALMDMVWDYATELAGGDEATPSQVADRVRQRRELILDLRKAGA